MTIMDTVITIAVSVQTLTMIVIAWITYRYTHFTRVMLELNIEPDVEVIIAGDVERNNIVVTNNSGCRIQDVNVLVLIGFTEGQTACPIRKTLCECSWPLLKPGVSVETPTPFITAEKIAAISDTMPNDEATNTDDLTVAYSFIRLADMKRYNYGYAVGFTEDPQNPDGPILLFPADEPERLWTGLPIVLDRPGSKRANVQRSHGPGFL